MPAHALHITAYVTDCLLACTPPSLQDTQLLVFGSSSSLDPDDVTNARTPFSFLWTCTALDIATQVCPGLGLGGPCGLQHVPCKRRLSHLEHMLGCLVCATHTAPYLPSPLPPLACS